MVTAVPIVGYPFIKHEDFFKERIDALISAMGHEAHWLEQESLSFLHACKPSTTRIPFVVQINDPARNADYIDLLAPLLEKFRTAKIISGNTLQIAGILFDQYEQLSLWSNKPPNEILKQVVNYIYTHLHDSLLTVPQICEACGIHRKFAEEKMKVWKGCSLWHYVIETRMVEARRLLVESEDSIYSIALHVGYEDMTTFGRVFKRQSNMSPKQYRQKYRIISQNSR